MKTVFACFATALLAAAAWPSHADPTPAQRIQVENCKIMSGAVFEFAQARDRKQAKMEAFKDVTHGQTYMPGSLLDETLQWAYAHPAEEPDTASGHFYSRCVLDAYDARNPDTEGELDIAAQACQQGHPGAPAAVRDCIEDKAQDIITRIHTEQLASAAPATATLSAASAPNSALLAQVAPPPQPVPTSSTAPAAPVTQLAVTLPAPAAAPPAMAPAPSLPAPAAVASASPPTAPINPTPSAQPVAAAAPVPQATAPVAVSQSAVASPAPVVVEAPAPAVAQASTAPLMPPQPAPVTPPLPAPVKQGPAPTLAKTATPQAVAPAGALPPLPTGAAPSAGPPPDLAGFGKLSVGMPMDEAYKTMGSHGSTDWDQQGEVHTYLIGDGHGFIEIRPSGSGTLASIRVVGGADAHVAPILNVVLGDGAFVLINNVGMPSSRTPLPGDKELWNYAGRNYAFEISPGGDVIGVRILDTGTDTTQ